MATGRTALKYARMYADGRDLSGYARTFGPLEWEFAEADMTCPMSDAAKGYLPDMPNIALGGFRGVFDNTATSGLHAVMGTPEARVILAPIGIRAVPAQGDPAFCGSFQQLTYHATEEGKAAVVDIGFGGWDPTGILKYERPWGTLLHALAATTAANTAVGVDQAAATEAGGYMVYQVTAGNGTATITVEHADTNEDGSFAALTGATSGEIDCSAVQSGLVQCAVTETVNRYVRWQLTLGTATTVTFALAFVRG